MATRTVRVRAPGDGELDGYVALPPASSGPGVVVLHEIFGLSLYIRDVADRLARLGYPTRPSRTAALASPGRSN